MPAAFGGRHRKNGGMEAWSSSFTRRKRLGLLPPAAERGVNAPSDLACVPLVYNNEVPSPLFPPLHFRPNGQPVPLVIEPTHGVLHCAVQYGRERLFGPSEGWSGAGFSARNGPSNVPVPYGERLCLAPSAVRSAGFRRKCVEN